MRTLLNDLFDWFKYMFGPNESYVMESRFDIRLNVSNQQWYIVENEQLLIDGFSSYNTAHEWLKDYDDTI